MKKKKLIRSALWLIAVCLFVVWAIIGHQYRLTYNHGESMEPAFSDGSWMMVEKRGKLPKNWVPDRYDVIVVRDEGERETLCKRVIGIPGDKIEIKEGYVFVNEKKLEDPYGGGRISFFLTDENDKDLYYWGTKEKVVRYADEQQIIVAEGYVWVIGDNRKISWYGMLPVKDIKGLVIL